MTGKVKWYSEDKGYGFIVPDEQGPDLFVHRTAIDGGVLTEGEAVEFEPVAGPKGPKATNVRRTQ